MAEVTLEGTTDHGGHGIHDPHASRKIVLRRLVLAVVIGACVAMLPLFGEYRLPLGIAITTVSIAADTYSLWVISRLGRPPVLLGIVDTALALAVAAAAPEALALITLVSATLLILFVMWYGRRTALLLGLLYEVGLVVIVWLHEPQWWAAIMITYALVTVACATTVSDLVQSVQDAQERSLSMINGLDAVVWEADGDDNTLFVSGNVGEVLGTDAETFTLPGFHYSRIHPDDIELLEASRAARARGEMVETHLRLRDDDGNYRWIQERQKTSRNADGSVRLRRGLLVDESARWEAESGLRRYMDFIEGIPVALVVLRLVDAEDPGSLVFVRRNPAAQAFVDANDGDRLVHVLPIDDRWLRELSAVALGGPPMEAPFVTLPGSDAVFTIRAVSLPDRHVGLTIEDITKRARLANSFRHQALHDELTGLPNRAHLRQRLAEVMDASDTPTAALLLVDLDQFKEINDTLGHHYGDRLLGEFALRLSNNLRGCDLIARLGGDEFAILITDLATETAAIEVAERLLRLCNRRFAVDEFRFQIGASVGVAVAPLHATDAETLLRKADTAMYSAKDRGGGWSLYSATHDSRDLRRLELMGDLRDAIRAGNMEVHYQPKMDLRTGDPVGIEALVRWRHPLHGLLPPDEFIELAEVSGCIRELTEFVTTRALEETGEMLARRGLTLSVNLSARTLHDPGLLTWLQTSLDPDVAGSGRLCFEITETELMEDPTRAMETLDAIRSMGIRFSVDDFGTGYSSLSYLRDLPIDEVKIDRTFVAGLAEDDTIVRAVIELGHSLGLRVVAEGVEHEATAEKLHALGCDSAQGFLWGPAVPEHELGRLLTRRAINREQVL